MNNKHDISRDPKRIRSMFSAIASRYDFGNHLLSANVDRLWRRRAASIGVGAETRRVLDCCCGTGDLAFTCSKKMSGDGLVVGCDFAKPMLDIAKEKGVRKNTTNHIALAAADSLHLPFGDDTFDLITIAFGLRNLADWEAGLREMRRALKPGGELLILEFSHPPNRLLRAIYYFYFLRLLPLIAVAGTGSKDYAYLPKSVMNFPSARDLAAMMEACGFRDARFKLLTGGIAAIHIGKK